MRLFSHVADRQLTAQSLCSWRENHQGPSRGRSCRGGSPTWPCLGPREGQRVTARVTEPCRGPRRNLVGDPEKWGTCKGVIFGQRCLLSGGGRDVDEGGRWQRLLEAADKMQLAYGVGVGISRPGAFCWDSQSSPVNSKGNQP